MNSEKEITFSKDASGDYLTMCESVYVAGSLWVSVISTSGTRGTIVDPAALLQGLHDLGVDVVGFQPKQSLEDKINDYLVNISCDDLTKDIMNIINNHEEDA